MDFLTPMRLTRLTLFLSDIHFNDPMIPIAIESSPSLLSTIYALFSK